MNKTNEQLEEELKLIGKHMLAIDRVVQNVVSSQANLYKLVATRVVHFSGTEQMLLLHAAQKCLDDLATAQASSKQFARLVE